MGNVFDYVGVGDLWDDVVMPLTGVNPELLLSWP